MPHFGGSILPSSDASTLQAQTGKWGSFQVKPILELETYGLWHMFRAEPSPEGAKGAEGKYYSHIIAMHPNGYSCKNLADRILMAWAGERDADYAFAQFQYILDCGGMGIKPESMRYIIAAEDYPPY